MCEFDPIAEMVDASIKKGPYSGVSDNCACGNLWHGLPRADCPGGYVESIGANSEVLD